MKKQDKVKIFIVEDEPFFANLINYDLEANYYDGIKVFFTGEEAVENLSLNPRVVILDHRLPGMSGLEVLKKIKAYNPDIHVIFLSGQTGAEVAISAFKMGAFDFIVKNETAFDEVRALLKQIFSENEEAEGIKVKNYPGKS
ncbi:MAG: response regulator [Bacteroidetes bacterium]|nr:response regulator [Bacteroidota bacterium]